MSFQNGNADYDVCKLSVYPSSSSSLMGAKARKVSFTYVVPKVKISLLEAVEAHMGLRRRGSHIFYAIISQWRWGQLHMPAVLNPSNIPDIFL
jgi:hypothetical protein